MGLAVPHFLKIFTMYATCYMSWEEAIKTLHSTSSSWRPCVYWCQSCVVCSELTYDIYSGGGSSTYVYCVVCYHVIAGPSVIRSIGCVFAQSCSWFGTPLDCFYYPKCFPLRNFLHHHATWLYTQYYWQCQIMDLFSWFNPTNLKWHTKSTWSSSHPGSSLKVVTRDSITWLYAIYMR